MGLEMIATFRKEKKMTLDELSTKSGIPISTIRKISAGITTDPNLSTVQAIANALGCTLDDFSDSSQFGENFTIAEKKMVKKYRALDKHGKEMVSLVLNKECERCSEPVIQVANEENTSLFPIDYLHQPVSAGTGLYTDETDFDELDLIKRPPRGSTCVIRVSGDSMEPTYRDGDKVFVRAQNVINPGQIGIFVIDGDLFIKELGDGALISHNSVYDPIPLNEDSRIECQGLVLGVCTDDYLYK